MTQPHPFAPDQPMAPLARFAPEDWMRLFWHVGLGATGDVLMRLCALSQRALRGLIYDDRLARMLHCAALVPQRYCPVQALGPDGTREKMVLAERLVGIVRTLFERAGERAPHAVLAGRTAAWIAWMREQGRDPVQAVLDHFFATLERPRKPHRSETEGENRPGARKESPDPAAPRVSSSATTSPDSNAKDETAAGAPARGAARASRPFDPARDDRRIRGHLVREMAALFLVRHLEPSDYQLLRLPTEAELWLRHKLAMRRAAAREEAREDAAFRAEARARLDAILRARAEAEAPAHPARPPPDG